MIAYLNFYNSTLCSGS